MNGKGGGGGVWRRGDEGFLFGKEGGWIVVVDTLGIGDVRRWKGEKREEKRRRGGGRERERERLE